jgi:hypothetical protein
MRIGGDFFSGLTLGVGSCIVPPMTYITNTYLQIRMIADRVGVDPWDVRLTSLVSRARRTESRPTSRYWFGSPCRFIRSVDFAVHVLLPEMLYERHPVWACYLRSTSPRWGRSWRTW